MSLTTTRPGTLITTAVLIPCQDHYNQLLDGILAEVPPGVPRPNVPLGGSAPDEAEPKPIEEEKGGFEEKAETTEEDTGGGTETGDKGNGTEGETVGEGNGVVSIMPRLPQIHLPDDLGA